MQLNRHTLWRLATVTAVLVSMLGFVVSTAAPASAAATCDISNFKNPDGSLDTTGYLQCFSPSVTPTTVAPGGTVEFKGGGFKPGSSVQIELVCGTANPVVVGTVTTNGEGNYDATVTIPTDTPPGSCQLEAVGVDSNGDPLTVVEAIVVTSTSTGTLPVTGSNTGEYLGLAIALIAIGSAAVWGSRREHLRRASRTTTE
ncbi:MAG TPA: hypothetical protein VMU14_02080 [Acidimicrobiales bacterium]|nr:hypothetical protein [Acidimicrobiales bacterium]